MRFTKSTEGEFSSSHIAQNVEISVKAGVDQSDYKVGCGLVMDYGLEDYLYTASNLNFSGVQNKAHAEQEALFQAIMDMRELTRNPDIKSVMVMTSDNDGALVCGHCLQVFAGACEEFGFSKDFEYISCTTDDLHDMGEPASSRYDFEAHSFDELMADSYVEKR